MTSPTAAELAALPVARKGLESKASGYGIADAIVFTLGAAGLLASDAVVRDAAAAATEHGLTAEAHTRLRAALGLMHEARRVSGDGLVPVGMALEHAGLLQSPEIAAELESLRARVAARPKWELGAEWAERLTAILAREQQARGGPWTVADALEGDGFPGHLWVVRSPEDAPDEESVVVSVGDRAVAEFIAATREDVPALLDVVEWALTNIRQHQDWHARDAERMQALQADASEHVPGLRESVRGWSERCRAAEAERDRLRIQLAEAQALAAGPTTWFLAEFEGIDPALFATLEAAQAWCADEMASDTPGRPWDWFEENGYHVQRLTDPDTDRPGGLASGSVLPMTPEAAAMVAPALGGAQ